MARKIIEVVDVSMQFKLEQNKEKSLKGFMVAALQKKIQYEVFQALEDISFSVKKGEDYWKKWGGKEYFIKNYFWDYEANKRKGGSKRKYCPYAGTWVRV